MHLFRNSKYNLHSPRILSKKPEFKLRTSRFSRLFWAGALLFSMAAFSGCATTRSIMKMAHGNDGMYPKDEHKTAKLVCSLVGDSLAGGAVYYSYDYMSDKTRSWQGGLLYGGVPVGIAGGLGVLCICHPDLGGCFSGGTSSGPPIKYDNPNTKVPYGGP